jgi:hypothetical protein
MLTVGILGKLLGYLSAAIPVIIAGIIHIEIVCSDKII